MLVWVILTIFIGFGVIACVVTIKVGAMRAPKEFPPYLLLLLILGMLMANWGVEWLPVPFAVDLAVRVIGVALIWYFLYRSGPMQRDFYGKLLWWKR